MAHDANWNVDKYREEHESEEQWDLRKAFLEQYKDDYPEDRLLCLARVFINMEFMGCSYPHELMREVAGLSEQIAKNYRKSKKGKLQRTFISASDAAEDRARGVKREGGVVLDAPANKTAKIDFVSQGQTEKANVIKLDSDDEDAEETEPLRTNNINAYLEEMSKMQTLDVRGFNEGMFLTTFGRLVLLMRPWVSKFDNIRASCSACGLIQQNTYENGCFTFCIGNNLVARATGATKADARCVVETLAWNRLRDECISVVVKEQFIAQGDSRITADDVSGNRNGNNHDSFGTPVESSVATKMMKMMGWSGGGLGADSQGIEEPIKPHLQMVKRAGLGSITSDIRQMRHAATELMNRYNASETLDIDLVFASDFSKEERAELHLVAKKCRLMSKSYGKDADRFLVVKKKLDPFSLVRAILQKGGVTPKYQVFLPVGLANR